MSGVQWMVVLIVAIVAIAKLASRGMRHEERKLARTADTPEAGRLREEVRALKERLAVLERIATDGNTTLERQIEALRDDPLLSAHDRGRRRDRADTHEG